MNLLIKSISLILISNFAFQLMGQEPGTLKWSYITNGEIYSSPTMDIDGIIYIGVNDITDDDVNDNHVIALNSDGSLKWKTEVGDWVDSTPALGANGVLYIGCWDGFLYALDSETGAKLWTFETFGVIDGSPAIGKDGVIYFGNGESALYAVSSDGIPVWTTGPNELEASPFLFQDWIDCSPTLDADNNIWVGDLFGNLSQIAPDKTELWNVDLGIGIPASPAIGKDGTIYIADEEGYVLAMTPGNDEPKWFFKTGLERIESSPIIGPDGSVYIGAGFNSLYAFDGQTGSVKTGWPFNEPTDVIYSTPAIAEDGTIYFGSGDNNLYAVDNSGKKRWSFQTGGFVDSSPAIGPDGTVYFGSTDGKVYAVYGDSPLGFSRWPKFRGSLAANGKVDPYRRWLEAENLSEVNPSSDPDNDGLENVLEWAFGTDPNQRNLNDARYPNVSFSGERLTVQAEWLVDALGVNYQYSETLNAWEALDFESPKNYPWLESVVSEVIEGKLHVRLELKLAESSPKFFRLSAIQN